MKSIEDILNEGFAPSKLVFKELPFYYETSPYNDKAYFIVRNDMTDIFKKDVIRGAKQILHAEGFPFDASMHPPDYSHWLGEVSGYLATVSAIEDFSSLETFMLNNRRKIVLDVCSGNYSKLSVIDSRFYTVYGMIQTMNAKRHSALPNQPDGRLYLTISTN